MADTIPLFDAYPALREALPREALIGGMTPVQALVGLPTPGAAVWIKRDDLTASAYGGNKVRKLEFLLAEAKARGARRVLTFGAAGSNHATATAIHAAACGLGSISMLTAQVNAAYVGRNLKASFAAGAELHHYPSERGMAAATRYQLARHAAADGVEPSVIRGGGSSPLGSVGFVNAGFELRRQIEAGDLPKPARIYLALGTTGTCAGLALGLAAAGIDTEIVAVRVVSPSIGHQDRLAGLFRRCNALLRELDPSFPACQPPTIRIRGDFLGDGYARFSPAGLAAVRDLDAGDGIALDGTYTGKAMAALLHDRRAAPGDAGPVLFWNTYSSAPLPGANVDYRRLPAGFHPYFEQARQALDTA